MVRAGASDRNCEHCSSFSALATGGNGTVYLTLDNIYLERTAQGWSAPIVISESPTLSGDRVCRIADSANTGPHLFLEGINPATGNQDVFYAGSSITKHYFGDGQQLATRLAEGDVYYHLNDPTGTSLVLVDANGDEAGRMVYDGYGMPLTNTLSPRLTGTLPDLPDAGSGAGAPGNGALVRRGTRQTFTAECGRRPTHAAPGAEPVCGRGTGPAGGVSGSR